MDTVTAEAIEIDFASPQGAGGLVVPTPTSAVPTQAPAAPISMLDIIDRASRDPSVDITKLERLIALKVSMESRQAQVEFDNAMADAQEDMKAIRADLFNKQTQSHYASYAQLDKATRPIYARHGFSLSFDTAPASDNCVRIVCTVAHRSGHRETRQIEMPADGKGAKGGDVMTRTHATGAAASYGQRYLLKLIFNLAVGDVDDDGNGADHNDDVERLATGPRGADGRLMSNYSAKAAEKAKEWADAAIQTINLAGNPEVVKEWRREAQTVPQGKKKSPLQWLEDNSPGQYMRVRQCYQNVTGEDLE